MNTEDKISAAMIRFMKERFNQEIDGCESPIEQLLMWAFVNAGCCGVHCLTDNPAWDLWRSCVGAEMPRACVATLAVSWNSDPCTNPPAEAFVFQQAKIGAYRADFAILVADGVDVVAKFVVEVDGHEFHERTKAQAKRDKARDRTMTAGGWRVLRFTGSEVWSGADACVDEIIESIERLSSEVAA